MNTTPQNFEPPMPGSGLFIQNADSAPAYWWLNDLWIVLAEAKDTGGRFSMMEEFLPRDCGPGPHKHTWSDETFYMLHGEINFLIGDEMKTARTGDFLMVPRNTRHAFRVVSEVARFLNGYTPASLEACIVEFAMKATERGLPPKNISQAITLTPELLSRYGMDILPGPDPLRPEHQERSSTETY
jgi:quercetin dioxygenase-like cupin family protein